MSFPVPRCPFTNLVPVSVPLLLLFPIYLFTPWGVLSIWINTTPPFTLQQCTLDDFSFLPLRSRKFLWFLPPAKFFSYSFYILNCVLRSRFFGSFAKVLLPRYPFFYLREPWSRHTIPFSPFLFSAQKVVGLTASTPRESLARSTAGPFARPACRLTILFCLPLSSSFARFLPFRRYHFLLEALLNVNFVASTEGP